MSNNLKVLLLVYVSLLTCMYLHTSTVRAESQSGVKFDTPGVDVKETKWDEASDDLKAQMKFFVDQEEKKEKKQKEIYEGKYNNRTLKFDEWKNGVQQDHDRRLKWQEQFNKSDESNKIVGLWDLRILPNLTEMTGDKYDYFIVDPESGEYMAKDLNLTLVLVFANKKQELAQYITDQMLTVQKQMKYKNVKICVLDPQLDEMMFDTFGRYRHPQIVVIDTNDQMAYYWDESRIADNKTMIEWLSTKSYRQSTYKIKPPKRYQPGSQEQMAEYAKRWIRQNIGKPATLFAKDLPMSYLLLPVIDFKGDDPLDFKLDKMCVIAIVLGFFLVGIPATWIFCKVTCFVCDGLCFVLCCCTHETKIIEVSEEEWARLKKEKKVQ